MKSKKRNQNHRKTLQGWNAWSQSLHFFFFVKTSRGILSFFRACPYLLKKPIPPRVVLARQNGVVEKKRLDPVSVPAKKKMRKEEHVNPNSIKKNEGGQDWLSFISTGHPVHKKAWAIFSSMFYFFCRWINHFCQIQFQFIFSNRNSFTLRWLGRVPSLFLPSGIRMPESAGLKHE